MDHTAVIRVKKKKGISSRSQSNQPLTKQGAGTIPKYCSRTYCRDLQCNLTEVTDTGLWQEATSSQQVRLVRPSSGLVRVRS
jgi:hypothetical protein